MWIFAKTVTNNNVVRNTYIYVYDVDNGAKTSLHYIGAHLLSFFHDVVHMVNWHYLDS